jgi:hypothetical protein
VIRPGSVGWSQRVVLVMALFVLACSDGPLDDGAAGGDAGDGGGAGVGGGGGGSGGAAPIGPIVVGPTDATVTLPFAATVNGEADATIGEISIRANVGSIEVNGEALPALAYEEQPFGQYTLYQTLVVAPDRLYVVWLYCEADQLTYVYFEGTDGLSLDYEVASGSCAAISEETVTSASFPALDMAVPELLPGYVIDGPSIQLDGASPGTIDFGGGPLHLLVFEYVDCTDCGGAGWEELHALMWDEALARLCFAVIYLFEPGEPLQVAYSMTVPDLSDPAGNTSLEATWTGPP